MVRGRLALMRPTVCRLALAVLLAALLVQTGKARTAAAAGATLNLPTVSCPGSGAASVTFNWTPVAGATNTYLDLSVQDGSFSSAGSTFYGYQVNGTTFNHPNLQAGAPHWWRVNSFVNGQWQPSAVNAFVPCGNPATLSVSGGCVDNNTAAFEFYWAPMGGPGGQQFIDVSSDANSRPAGSRAPDLWPQAPATTSGQA